MSKLKLKKEVMGVGNDLSMLSLVWELGYMIAIPIVVLAVGGAWLDKKMGTSPWMLLLGVGSSIIMTSFMVYSKVAVLMSDLGDTKDKGSKKN
ncbi:MAG TPA: AtpZ/AtpI family protein [Campylobacterales bacterium]|nr:AtpZ/AtpI family protein [Campylobacterales bacterium]